MTVSLVAIVRDASASIDRMLTSAAPHIDSAVIVDTGSEDDTREKIRAHGYEPFEREWVSFSHNRSEALALAGGKPCATRSGCCDRYPKCKCGNPPDYLLMLDADMTLDYPAELPPLTADVYEGTLSLGGLDYTLPILIRGDREWRYEGVAHACLASDQPYTSEVLPGLRIHVEPSTGPAKLERDLAALSQAHAADPLDARTAFYLAQTYNDLGRPKEAAALYRARANMPGWDEETFYAQYRLGCLLGEHIHGLDGMRELLAAYEQRPGRAEPLRALARLADSIADKIPYPNDRLFVHRDAYRRPAPVAKTISDVTAIIVTRGDQPDAIQQITDQLPYTEIIVWDNSQRAEDAKCYGRFLAMREATNDLVFLIDDDVIFTAHEALRAAHEPGRITANMPSPWYENAGYDQEQSVQVGAGSLMERHLPQAAFDAYLGQWPLDDLFLTYCDDIAGILTPSLRVDLGYEVLPHASAPGRIYTSEGSQEKRKLVAARALELREAVTA